MMDEKELVARAEALGLSQRIRPQPQQIKVHITPDGSLRSDLEVPITLAYQGGTQLTQGQLKIRSVMVELEQDITKALIKASEKLRNIALQPWAGEK